MKSITLFPHRYQTIGWIILIASLIAGIIISIDPELFNIEIPYVKVYDSGMFLDVNPNGWFVTGKIGLDNLIPIAIIIGGCLVGFSEEKEEDEYLNRLRLEAMFKSFKISYLLVLILFLTVFGLQFLYLMFVCILLPLLMYIFYFKYLTYRFYNEK